MFGNNEELNKTKVLLKSAYEVWAWTIIEMNEKERESTITKYLKIISEYEANLEKYKNWDEGFFERQGFPDYPKILESQKNTITVLKAVLNEIEHGVDPINIR